MGSLYRRLAGRIRPRAAAVRSFAPSTETAATGAGSPRIERLEPRRLLSVSLDAHGWTVVTPERGQLTVYVSSSAGDDRNDGLTTKRPVRSLARAAEIARDGQGDRILLRAGDVWYGRFPEWNTSGKSKQEPLLISSYGPGERPIIKSGDRSGFRTGRRPIKHVKLIGLHFHAHTRDPYSPREFTDTDGADGLYVLSPLTNFHVEDCVFDAYEKNAVFQNYYGKLTDVTVRRNVFTDATGSGLYASGVNGIAIEENVFDHNGYNELLPKYNTIARRPGHNIYLQSNVNGVVVRGNLIADAGSHGLQARAGGIVRDNVFVRNPIHMSFGFVNGASLTPGGVAGEIGNNVFLGGRDIAGHRRGWALEIGNTRPGGGTIVTGNVFAHDAQDRFAAIRLGHGKDVTNASHGVGINDLRIEGNVIYKWHRAIDAARTLVAGGTGYRSLSGVSVRANHFQVIRSSEIVDLGAGVNADHEAWAGNAYFRAGGGERFESGGETVGWGTWHQYVDKTGAVRRVRYFAPERGVETYNAVLGGLPRVKSFMAEARLQSRRLWRDEYATAAVAEYVRSGFDLVSGPPRVTLTNLDGRWHQTARRRLVVHFNQDVSATLDKADLVVASRDTGRVIRARDMQMTYDRINHVAVWTFPGVDRRILPAGRWRFRLLADEITGSGRPLDGNADGAAGDDWTQVFTAIPVA